MAPADPTVPQRRAGPPELADAIGRKERRKIKGRAARERSPWFYAGMFGIVGWSVAVPTVLGILGGWLIDRAWPGRVSWTLTLMLAGVALGCLNAWFWVKRESTGDD